MQLVQPGVLLLAMTVFIFSCNDKFMDRFSETRIGVGSFFNSEEDLRLYSQGMYDFPSTGIYSNDSYTLTDNGGSTGNVELKTMMMGNPNSTNITSGWEWSGLRRVNVFLANFGKAAISQERLDHFEGLGRFFRARFYVNKVKRYSDVPWIDQLVGTASEDILYGPRDSRELVVNKIIEDYEFAAGKVDLSAPAGAVTRWVVKADFARFLLYEGTFRKYHSELGLESSAATLLQKAADLTKDIMENGGYGLHANYGELFYNANLVGNKEVIFTRRYEHDVLNGDAGDGFFGNYEAYPSKDMLQAYLMKDGSFYSSQPNYRQNEFVEEFANRDSRLYNTYAYPGWVLVRTGTYSRGAGIYVQQLQKNFSGYHQIKGFYNTTITNDRNDIDVPLYRYAEILLIHAEAKAELGQLTQGDLDITINLLRDRAGMPHLMMGAAVDPVEDARFPNVTGALKGEILEIRRERRVELAFEGFRYDDLMRWEAGKTLEKEPLGLHFRSLGYHDLTGDGVPDIKLLPYAEAIPNDRENNALGKPLEYYRVGAFGQTDASIFLSGPSSGSMLIIEDIGNFVTPKYYYRPVPKTQTELNPGLKQIFGWE